MRNVEEPKIEFKMVKELEDFFKLQYKLKFGKIPGTTFADRHRLGELLKNRSDAEVKTMISHFIKMNDPGFKKLGYSLDTFFQAFNKILSDLENKQIKKIVPKQMPLIQTLGFCRDLKCTTRFLVTVPMNLEGLDQKLCPTCEKSF